VETGFTLFYSGPRNRFSIWDTLKNYVEYDDGDDEDDDDIQTSRHNGDN